MMPHQARFWAIGYGDAAKAERLRAEIEALAGTSQDLLLYDIAVLTRSADGSYTLNRQPFPLTSNILPGGTLGFLAGVALAAPMVTSVAIASLLGADASTVANSVGIEDAFIRDAERLMKPGVSAVLVLVDKGDLETILNAIRGLGGTVLKTNVDLERARLVQTSLSAEPAGANAISNGDPR
ncbi:MAG: DUF1269 domain-containing protein [Tepidisphaeraceae bacterium]|jgi:uncharacterized membrane protein